MTGIIVLIAVVAIASIVLLKVDFNRFGKTDVYIEVIEPSEVIEDVLPSGEVMKRFAYEQVAYDEKGKEVDIYLTANKELRKGAYLKVYLNKKGNVTSYDEVEQKELPENVQEKF